MKCCSCKHRYLWFRNFFLVWCENLLLTEMRFYLLQFVFYMQQIFPPNPFDIVRVDPLLNIDHVNIFFLPMKLGGQTQRICCCVHDRVLHFNLLSLKVTTSSEQEHAERSNNLSIFSSSARFDFALACFLFIFFTRTIKFLILRQIALSPIKRETRIDSPPYGFNILACLMNNVPKSGTRFNIDQMIVVFYNLPVSAWFNFGQLTRSSSKQFGCFISSKSFWRFFWHN